MKTILKFLQSRLAILMLVIIAQLVLLIGLVRYLTTLSPYVSVAFAIFSFLVAAWLIVGRQQKIEYKFMWVIVILAVPVFGGIFYLIFGTDSPSDKKIRQRIEPYMLSGEHRAQETEVTRRIEQNSVRAALQSSYITNTSGTALYDKTKTDYYPSGEEFFEALLYDIRQAQRYIFLEFFIIERGYLLDTLIAELAACVERGVEVRFMYDDVGSALKISSRFPQKMADLGINAMAYNGRGLKPGFVLNNRDHRKIAIIDGCVAYTGGCNLADEYINVVPKFGYWKDSMVRLEGKAVWGFVLEFLDIWDFSAKKQEDDLDRYRPLQEDLRSFARFDDGFVQPYADDSPFEQEPIGRNVYLNLIESAEKLVYITTPYLIIDEETKSALRNAALMGLDVRIAVPGIPDKPMVFEATRANYPALLKAGVRIYEFTPGFLHAKSMVADRDYAVVGTCNFDYRSFYLHFECGAWMYQSQAVQEVYDDFLNIVAASREITLADIEALPWWRRTVRALLAAFAPLL